MIGTGTIVNTAAILAGGLAGGFLKNGVPEKYKSIITDGIGLAVVVLGISGTLQGLLTAGRHGALSSSGTMVMILSLLVGGVLGELLNIEGGFERSGRWLQSRFHGDGGTAEGFVTATLLFCTGAMAILGSLQDGLGGNAATLYAKSVLDGVMAAVFASYFGWGVLFSALPVLLYEGAITLLAGLIGPWFTGPVVSQMSAVGNVLILALGINLLGLKKIRVSNFIPAVFLPLVYSLLMALAKKL